MKILLVHVHELKWDRVQRLESVLYRGRHPPSSELEAKSSLIVAGKWVTVPVLGPVPFVKRYIYILNFSYLYVMVG